MRVVEQAIKRAIVECAGGLKINEVVNGVARNVTETTCDVERANAAPLLGTSLNAVGYELDSYVTIYPCEGSEVLAGVIDGDKSDCVLLRCSEVEKVNIKIGTQTVTIDKNGIICNGGEFGGVVKVEAMVEWMSKLYDDLQMLKTQLSTHPVAGNSAPLSLVFNPRTPNPQIGTFSNEKVKH